MIETLSWLCGREVMNQSVVSTFSSSIYTPDKYFVCKLFSLFCCLACFILLVSNHNYLSQKCFHSVSFFPLVYNELDSFGSLTVPGHLRINIFVFSRMSNYTDLLVIQSFSQIYKLFEICCWLSNFDLLTS